jgi:hypothetical protein
VNAIHRSSAALVSVLALVSASASMAEPASRYVQTMRGYEQVELAPNWVRGFSNPLEIGLDNEPALNTLAQPRRADRSSSLPERPTPWTLYGRVGVLNFQNELGAEQGTRLGLKRTGPALSGKVYFGIRKQW